MSCSLETPTIVHLLQLVYNNKGFLCVHHGTVRNIPLNLDIQIVYRKLHVRNVVYNLIIGNTVLFIKFISL